jgi:peptidyl-prolyl cis-trans isomerase B (cyclophilin B)
MKRFITVIASLGLLLTAEEAISASSHAVVNIQTTEGKITIELDDGPTVTNKNFLHYVNEGFYDGTIFHRVISGFMIQAGGFLPDMTEKALDAPPIKNEGSLCGKNIRGTVAMARTSDPHSATAQFFINAADNHFLDFVEETAEGWGYCSFGHVTEGMEIVDKIEAVTTGATGGYQDVPVNPVLMKSVTVVEPTQ